MDKVLTHYTKTSRKAVYNISMPDLVKVVFDIPINDSFDYISDDKKVKIGSRVRVSFGNTTRIGVIIDIIAADSKSKTYKIKKIDELIDEVPVLTKEMFKTCKWASSYYHHPIGQVIFSAMTPLHRKQRKEPTSELEIQHNESFEELILNTEQKKIYDSLIEDKKKFKVNVIRGVTGSGKTELYVKLAKKSIEENLQILVMVPEINLIPQTLERFKKYLKIIPLQYHSNLTPTQKHKVWKACSKEEQIIVIGTRSSIFLPFKKLGLIVVDEEHDGSYKQTEMFKYNARDIGILRGHNFKCPVILGSATPSFETVRNIKINKYQEYRLEKRYYKSKLPMITIIDSSIDRPNEGLTNTLIKSMKIELEKNRKVILFLGRRGFSNSVICSNCKTIVKCPKCGTNMTYHKNVEKLICHNCDFKQNIEQVKKCCDNPVLTPLGIGTQRVENKVKQLFPNKTVLRVDSDNITSKKDLEDFIEKANNNKIDIFIGTQMIVKGHDFKDISLVGILNIDAGLYSTDFRGLEKTAQLITQVSGRSGRQTEHGNVLIQTHNPDHSILNTILKEGYEKFSHIALEQRKNVNLPPYSHIGIIVLSSSNMNFSKSVLNKLKEIKRNKSIFIYGPAQSKVPKRNNQYNYQLLIGSNSSKLLSEHISKFEIYLSSLKKKIRWHIDIDPLES